MIMIVETPYTPQEVHYERTVCSSYLLANDPLNDASVSRFSFDVETALLLAK